MHGGWTVDELEWVAAGGAIRMPGRIRRWIVHHQNTR